MAKIDQTQSPPFHEVVQGAISRRNVLAGSASAALLTMFGCAVTNQNQRSNLVISKQTTAVSPLMQFKPVSVREAAITSNRQWPLISDDYDFELILPWGDPIEPSGPKFAWPPSPENQAHQIGIGHDGMWFFPDPNNPNSKGALALNHEFGSTAVILGKAVPQNLDEVRVSQHAHGVSVLNIERVKGKWMVVGGDNVRRIHVNTPVEFSGPVAEHELLKNSAGNKPMGTLNNCAMGHTPWNTYLTCEENWPFYFGTTSSEFEPTDEQKPYNLTGRSFYGWHNFDPRFDLRSEDHTNESNRFGWVVEIDPWDAQQVPVKHTALGRFGHEGATVAVGKDDRIVVYMGDDMGGEHVYKFVSSGDYNKMVRDGVSPLSEGRLYVARFNDDFSGDWLELSTRNSSLAERFDDDAEILTFPRIASKFVGATPMDRPEWIAITPTQDVYCTLTNNTGRTTPNAANPLAPNVHGHIVRWRDEEEYTGTKFSWDVFTLAANTQQTENLFSSPDGLWADSDGRLFIETDGNQSDDENTINNQLLVMDTNSGEIRRLFTGVSGCEITGLAVTPDQKTMFINIQHPGIEARSPHTGRTFPDLGGVNAIPRDCTVVLYRKDGGIVGS
ncbi:MAG: PhoX family phosphatase [Gammaproteobacteria bacterium]|nr:PhoX family phosphatase [Gammaproteobacteria bacterium]